MGGIGLKYRRVFFIVNDAICGATVALLYCILLKATRVNFFLAHFTVFFMADAMIIFTAQSVG